MYRGPEARRPPGERTCRARHASEQRARKRLRPAVPDTPPLFPDSSALDASGQLTAGRRGAVEGQACHFGRPGRRSWRWAGSRLRASEVVPGPPTQLAWHPEGWRGRPGGGGWELLLDGADVSRLAALPPQTGKPRLTVVLVPISVLRVPQRLLLPKHGLPGVGLSVPLGLWVARPPRMNRWWRGSHSSPAGLASERKRDAEPDSPRGRAHRTPGEAVGRRPVGPRCLRVLPDGP